MSLIYIEEEKCVRCAKCIKFCPMDLIESGSKGFPKQTIDAYQRCINCGYCVDICIYDALFHKVRKRDLSSENAALKRYENLLKRGEKNHEK